MQNQEEFPGKVYSDETGKTSFLVSTVDKFCNWARSNSLWPLSFGTSCCAIEMMSAASAKYDWSRFGFEVARETPRQADLLIVAGTITYKMAPVLRRLYDQMAEPKYVIAMGACTISGGPFAKGSYSVVNGVDQILPVDVYIPGCPPRPEALLYGMIKLQEKIKKSRAYVIDKQKETDNE
ncbi:MAG: NADH-quinone oxidoreductase subunit B family protein [Bacteroidota bacterium]|nr:NADH-quinone oxidoreductase subunit B family protein [Bacteroidota bacterium]MDP4206097.1 NADH-quinone oxidoreductase subunit B family protein [Bacteroidota bacterium]